MVYIYIHIHIHTYISRRSLLSLTRSPLPKLYILTPRYRLPPPPPVMPDMLPFDPCYSTEYIQTETDRHRHRHRHTDRPTDAIRTRLYIYIYIYICIYVSIDRPFIVLTETKSSNRHIPVWARYSPLRTRVEAHANT